MAFPTTGILDNFNRADATPPSSSWSLTGFASNDLELDANEVQASAAGTTCDDYWNVSTFGPSTEAYVTITRRATAGDYASALLDGRISSPGSGANIDSYEMEIIMREGDVNVNIVRVWKGVNGSYTQMGADISTTVNSGDAFGIEITGSTTTTITLYRKPSGGSWGSIGSRSDSSSPITAAGNIALGMYDSIIGEIRLDDFGGGTVTSAVVGQLIDGHLVKRGLLQGKLVRS